MEEHRIQQAWGLTDSADLEFESPPLFCIMSISLGFRVCFTAVSQLYRAVWSISYCIHLNVNHCVHLFVVKNVLVVLK